MRLAIPAAMLLLTAATLGATTLTFDDLVGQATLPINYGGISWNAGWEHYDFEQPPFTPSSGATRVYNNAGSEALLFSFLAPDARLLGAYFAGLESVTAQWELYNDGVLVHSSTVIGLSAIPTFLPSGYEGTVDEVRVLTSSGFFVMDDLQFEASGVVPEPGTAAIVFLGLGATLLYRRLKR
ncbi:MAG: PEP-CTERM sorting domain-containing protein [Bryobacteraceae bacterium]|nr:PEP-CTERM sorting domain-containing protein [Bryobacteraceae bacterium]